VNLLTSRYLRSGCLRSNHRKGFSRSPQEINNTLIITKLQYHAWTSKISVLWFQFVFCSYPQHRATEHQTDNPLLQQNSHCLTVWGNVCYACAWSSSFTSTLFLQKITRKSAVHGTARYSAPRTGQLRDHCETVWSVSWSKSECQSYGQKAIFDMFVIGAYLTFTLDLLG